LDNIKYSDRYQLNDDLQLTAMQSKPMKEIHIAIEQLAAARARGQAIKIKASL